MLEKQRKCNHEFKKIAANEKTIEGYYNDPNDDKEGECYNMYYCIKCSLILSVDYNIDDLTPVEEFEKKYKIINKDTFDETPRRIKR